MPNTDLEALLDMVLPHAQQLLTKYGEFFPFGAVMTSDGDLEGRLASNGNEQPPSQVLIDMITQSLRQSAAAREIRAACICFDVRTVRPGHAEKSDAISVVLEHENGQATAVFMPYERDGNGAYHYGELFFGHRNQEFFVL